MNKLDLQLEARLRAADRAEPTASSCQKPVERPETINRSYSSSSGLPGNERTSFLPSTFLRHPASMCLKNRPAPTYSQPHATSQSPHSILFHILSDTFSPHLLSASEPLHKRASPCRSKKPGGSCLPTGTKFIEKKVSKPLLDERQIRELVAEYVRSRAPRSEGEILGMGIAGEGNEKVTHVENAVDEFSGRLGEEPDRMQGAEGSARNIGFGALSLSSGTVDARV